MNLFYRSIWWMMLRVMIHCWQTFVFGNVKTNQIIVGKCVFLKQCSLPRHFWLSAKTKLMSNSNFAKLHHWSAVRRIRMTWGGDFCFLFRHSVHLSFAQKESKSRLKIRYLCGYKTVVLLLFLRFCPFLAFLFSLSFCSLLSFPAFFSFYLLV